MLNGKYIYNDDLYYGLYNGSYIFTNIPDSHPMAILSEELSEIQYSVVDDEPILIYVKGGQYPGPYYNFKDENGKSIDIINGTYKFMRGRSYKFIANGISNSHPFQIYSHNCF